MTIAVIQDVPLLNTGSIRWSLRDGVRPVIETFHVTPAGRNRLAGFVSRPVKLDIDVGGGSPVSFRNLYILDFPPGPNPYIHGVRVADRRWLWPYAHVFRRYNMRRRIGYRRSVQPNVALQLQPVTDDLLYRKFSVKNPEAGFAGRWTGVDTLEDVLDVVLDKERERFGVKAETVFKDIPFEVPIENLVIDDAGDAATNRILAQFPDAGLFIDPAGRVVVYSKASGEDRELVPRAGAEIVGQGHVDIVDQRVPRPRAINCYFTREVEVRLDYRSEGASPSISGVTGSTTMVVEDSPADNILPRADGGFGGLIENVLPLPDYSLNVGGKVQVQGSWVTINDVLFTAWGDPPGGRKITDQIVRLEFVPFIDSFFNRLSRFGSVDPTADWNARIAALTTHYRRTFRIREKLMDRIIAIKAERVGNVNPATGQRGPAVAYGDWCVVPTAKHFYLKRDETSYILNHSSFNGSFALTDTSDAMPVSVSVIDQDQGIIRLDYKADPTATFQEFIPGNIINVPKAAIRDQNIENTHFNTSTRRKLSAPVQLKGDFRLAIVLTVIPAAPNHKGQLQKVTVTAQQAAQALPRSLRFNPGDATGPPMDVRIGPGVETARVAWVDSAYPEIFQQAFGFGGKPRQAGTTLEALTVNFDQGNSIQKGASLSRIAVAEAARIYATFADRYQGQMAGRIQSGIEPAGSLSEVVFELDSKGVGTVRLNFPERFEPLSFFALLDASTRAVVLQLATHQRD